MSDHHTDADDMEPHEDGSPDERRAAAPSNERAAQQPTSAPLEDGEPLLESTDKDATLEEAAEAALRRVRDPEADKDVFEAGLIEELTVADGTVTIRAALEGFRTEDAERVSATMVRAVSAVDGVEGVHVERTTPGTDVDANRGTGLEAVDRVIAIASAKGGVGKSTVATYLACALAGEDHDVGLFDADIHGPNVPDLLEVSGPVYSDDDGNPLPVEVEDLCVMSVGLMESGAPLAWRGAMAHDALSELFEDTAWGALDTLIVDLPPGTGDVVLTTLQEIRVDGVVVVTTPFQPAVSDTERSVALFRENDVPVLGTVVNMGSFACPSCGDAHDLFPDGSPLDDHDAPVLAELPFTHELQRTPVPGAVPDPISTLAARVDDRFTEIWDVTVPDEGVDIRGLDSETRRERVRKAFAALDSGEPFALVSDRDPTPVRSFLADVAGVDPSAFDRFAVRQQNPDTWHLRTERP